MTAAKLERDTMHEVADRTLTFRHAALGAARTDLLPSYLLGGCVLPLDFTAIIA